MRRTESVAEIVAASGLPDGAAHRIREVVRASNLSGDRAADVARELVAHFEDGLASGRSIEDLLDAFGNDDRTASLIARTHRPDPVDAGAPHLGGAREMGFAAAWRNLRHGLRRMAQSPGFSAIAVLSLAIGIGANTAMFSLVNTVILRDLPFENPERLVELYKSVQDFEFNVLSYPEYREVRDGSADVFDDVAVAGFAFASLDGPEGVELVPAEVVSGNYFSMLGVEAASGRLFTPEEDVAVGAHAVAVLGHGYWLRAFAGASTAVGGDLRINGREYRIIGVLPEEYQGAVRTVVADIFLPTMMINEVQPSLTDRLEQRGSSWLFARARLAEGVTVQQAEARLERIAEAQRRDFPRYWDPTDAYLVLPSSEVIMWPPIDRFLVPIAGLFMVLVGLVLLVACANLASFLLAQTMDRRKEISIRLALGATRRSIVAQLLTEAVALALVGGAAGVAMSIWILRTLLAVETPLPIPIVVPIVPDATVLGFTLLVSTVAGVMFGLAPALQGKRGDVAAALKQGGTATGLPRRLMTRNALVVAQVAFSLVLLVAAGLFIRSARATAAVDPGFGDLPTGVLTIALPTTRYDEAQGRQTLRRLEERFRRIPGVDAVGMIDNLHLSLTNTMFIDFNVDGVEPPEGVAAHRGDRASVDAGFFTAAGVDIVSGRNFRPTDTIESTPVAIVSRALADRFWPDGSAVGRVLRRGGDDRPDLTIIGVAADTKVRTINEPPRMFVYTALSQDYSPFVTFIARTRGDADAIAVEMLAAGRQIDPLLMVAETTTVEQHIGMQLLPARLAAVVLSAFAALTLLLASIGLYGVVSYAVSQRAHEVGIRISLGAESGEVVRMLTVGGMGLVAVGAAVGLLLSAVVAYTMSTLLYGVGAFDPTTFVLVPLLLLAVAFVAAYLPARRASRVDPVVALRAG